MKGILIKDIEVLRTGSWIIPFLALVFFALPEMVMKSMGILFGFYFIMSMLLTDEQLPFTFCLPWKRWQLVASRFLWVAGSAAFGILGGITSTVAFRRLDSLLMAAFCVAALLFGGSILMLVNFCVPKKAKTVATVVAMVLLLTWNMRVAVRQAAQWTFTGAQLGLMVLGAIVFAAIAFGISVLAIEKTEV